MADVVSLPVSSDFTTSAVLVPVDETSEQRRARLMPMWLSILADAIKKQQGDPTTLPCARVKLNDTGPKVKTLPLSPADQEAIAEAMERKGFKVEYYKGQERSWEIIVSWSATQ
jgi:hypothetical protein